MATQRIKNNRGGAALTRADALPEERYRVKWGIQNCSQSVLNVTFGDTTIQLKACTAASDGNGGVYNDGPMECWCGAVTVDSDGDILYNLWEYTR